MIYSENRIARKDVLSASMSCLRYPLLKSGGVKIRGTPYVMHIIQGNIPPYQRILVGFRRFSALWMTSPELHT